jgi:hypothetical protein
MVVIAEAIRSIELRLDAQNVSSSIYIITVALNIVGVFSTK